MNLVRRNAPRRFLLPSVLIAIAFIALAACGSDSKSSTSAGGSSSSSSSSTAPAAAAVIKTAEHGDLGTILVDANGKTVYTLTKEDQPVSCTGACVTAWPPVLIPAGTDQATGSDGVTGLALVSAADGKQVARDGLPLYTFSGDAAAGDANGEGLASFGGVWRVVTIKGGGATSNTSSTTSSSGY